MATYNKGFKKQNPQLTILKTIVVIIAAVASLVLVAFVYDKATSWQDYKSYEHIETYDKVLNNGKENYVVYFYSKTCPTCKDIKNDTLKIIKNANKDGNLFYLVDVFNIKEVPAADKDDTITKAKLVEALGVQDITTPMMVVVAEGKFKEVIVGKLKIEEFMNQINKDTYEPFN